MADIGPLELYESYPEFAGDGTIDHDGHTFKALLLDSGHTKNLAAHDELADIVGDELAATNGYARQTLTGVVWSHTGDTTTFTCDPITFAASGGAIAARYLAIYDDTSTGDKLIGIATFLDAPAPGGSPADVVISDGNELELTPTTGLVRYVIVPA